MTSALSPREIQTRIRSGASLEDVAQESGMPTEKVEPYAAPVLAEREHVALTALQCPVRRRGETGSVRAMRAVVAEKLGPRADEVTWDAWRNQDRRWTVTATLEDEGETTTAHFVFDPRARFSTAQDDAARELIGEVTANSRVAVAESPDAEPTIDLNDELALVRATQATRGSLPGQRPPFEAATPAQLEPGAESDADAESATDDSEVDDYSPAEFEEVDGVYDFVPKNTSDMDVLYEMLSSFAEDSVNIYAGLANPVTQEPSDEEPERDSTPEPPATPEPVTSPEPVSTPEPAAPAPAAAAEQPPAVVDEASEPESTPEPSSQPQQDEAAVEQVEAVTVVESPTVEPSPAEPVIENDVVAQVAPIAGGDTPPEGTQPQDTQPQDEAVAQGPATQDVGAQPPASEPELPVDVPKETATPRPRPKPRSRKKRASIPSWDEIMFGGPTNQK